jgi:hypothetical protein
MINNGNAKLLKNKLTDYREFILTLTKDDDVRTLIGSLLNTDDAPSIYMPNKTDTWEEQMFPQGAFFVTALGALNSVENSVLIAQNVLLESMR